MPPKRRKVALLLLAAAMLMPAASAGMADDDVPAMLESMPGMQLIAAVDAMHAGDLTKADALFTLAIQQGKLAPEGMVHAWFNRGLVRQRMGNLQLAIADFSKALESDVLSTTGRVEAYYNRGLAWRKLGALQKAMDDFSRAIELQPRFAPAYYSRALGLAANGHYLLALVDLNKALKYGFPQKHKVHYSKAMIHLARGEEKLAIRELRRALKANPRFKPAQQRLAALQRRQGWTAAGASLLPLAGSGGALHVQQVNLSHDVETALAEDVPPPPPPPPPAARPMPRQQALAPARRAGRRKQHTSNPQRMATTSSATSSAAASFTPPATRQHARSRRTQPAGQRHVQGQPQRIITVPRPVARHAAVARRAAASRRQRTTLPPVPVASAETGMAVPGRLGASASPLSQLITGSINRTKSTGGSKTLHKQTASRKAQDRLPSAVSNNKGRHGGWAVQLAASRSERDMALRWKILRPRVSRIITAPRVRITRAVLQGRGVFHRLRLVGFSSRQQAAEHCASLKAAGISCVVARAR